MSTPTAAPTGRGLFCKGGSMSDLLNKRRTWLSVVLCGLLILVLLLIPTGFEQAGAAYHDGGERIAADRAFLSWSRRSVRFGLYRCFNQESVPS